MQNKEYNSSSEGEFQEEQNYSSEEEKSKEEMIFNEDNALEIIDLEFRDLEDWMKTQMKRLRRDCHDIIECLKVKKNYLINEDYE